MNEQVTTEKTKDSSYELLESVLLYKACLTIIIEICFENASILGGA